MGGLLVGQLVRERQREGEPASKPADTPAPLEAASSSNLVGDLCKMAAGGGPIDISF